MQMKPIDFEKIALKIVPRGERPSKPELRREIAETMSRVVDDAIEAYRQEQWPPEMRRLVAEVRKNQADASTRLSALEKERIEFKKVVKGHLELLDAIENWIEWCEGGGTIDDHPTLWLKVKESWAAYRTLRTAV